MLVQHTDFTYMLLFRYFPELCSILEENGKAIGYVVGFRTGDTKVAYLWQLGVVPEYQARGFSRQLIDAFVNNAQASGCSHIQFSIEPENEKSRRAFSSYAKQRGIPMLRTEGDDITFERTDGSGINIDQVFLFDLCG
jgi:L-2,4-diaminobutyric acid acetyltransferase